MVLGKMNGIFNIHQQGALSLKSAMQIDLTWPAMVHGDDYTTGITDLYGHFLSHI